MSETIKYQNVTRQDSAVIREIAERAQRMARRVGVVTDLVEWQMDITAVHANVQRLRLEELLTAEDFDFSHDVFGIRRHLDRESITLGGAFLPRFSERPVAVRS